MISVLFFGRAETGKRAEASKINEKSETKTSSPFPTPNILKQVHKAVVADDVVKQYLALVNLIISEMKSATFCPLEYIPDSINFSIFGEISSKVSDGFIKLIRDILLP